MTLQVAPPAADAGGYTNLRGVAMSTTRQPMDPVRSPRALQQTAATAAQRQAQVAGEGAPLRIVLGMDTIGAQLGPVWYKPASNKWYIRAIWARGPSVGVQNWTLNDQTPPAGINVTHYAGTADQTIDPWLVSAGAAQSPAVIYTDTLANGGINHDIHIAYSVFEIPAGLLTSWPVFKAEVKGLLLYDDRTATTVWTDNAGLALAAFIRSTWGMSRTITGGVTEVADRCDVLVGVGASQEKRSRIGLTLDTRQLDDNWLAMLQTIAECFVVPDSDGYLMIPDAPAESEYTFDTNAATLIGNVSALGTIKRSATNNLPTVITGYYTDRSVQPYKDAAITPIKRPGVDAGTTPWIPQEIRINGVFSRSQMTRICTTRLNKLWLCDLSGTLHGLDDAENVRPGTVVTLNDERGLVAKQARIFGKSGAYGQIVLSWQEHDNAVHSDVVVGEPTTPDTPQPLPNAPPLITDLAITESFVPNYHGRGVTRFFVSWTAPVYFWLVGYWVEVWAGTQIIDSAPVSNAFYASPPVVEGVTYTIKVSTLSSVAQSAWVQNSKLAQGKLLLPGDVQNLDAYEVGGTLYGFIVPAEDIDLTGHEYRYASINGSESVAQHWARGKLIDRIAAPSVRLENSQMPEGTWRLMVKGLDSVRTNPLFPYGQESANAIYKDVIVTSDSKSFWADSFTYDSYTLTNMLEYEDYPPLRVKIISANGTPFATLFPDPLGTYTNVLATYDAPTSSQAETAAHDHGALVAGQWNADVDTADCNIVDLSGSHVVYLALSPDGTSWTEYTGTSIVAAGRFSKVRIESDGVMVITGIPTVRIQAKPYTEEHTIATSASGPVTLTLDRHYVAAAGEPIARVTGSTLTHAQCDNIVVSDTADNTVDVYAWDNAGALVVANVGVTFNGILAT